MSINCRLVFISNTDRQTEFNNIIRINFKKDRYLPYTYLSGSFIGNFSSMNFKSVKFYIDDKLIHFGLLDTVNKIYKNGRWSVNFTSRSFTSLLAQNESVPKMNYNVNLESITALGGVIPNITYESNTDNVNYIYVNEHSSVWDAITAYAMKAYSKQPFIYGTNEVRINELSSISREYEDGIVETGEVYDCRRQISKAFMEDIEGEYSSSMTNSKVVSDLVRTKYFALDRQWLSNPTTGLRLKINTSNRRYQKKFFSYIGYNGEDLFDYASLQTSVKIFLPFKIHEISIRIENNRIVTTLASFAD